MTALSHTGCVYHFVYPYPARAMTDMTRLTRLRSPRSSEVIDAEVVDSSQLASTRVEALIAREQVMERFLKHYESFTGTSVDSSLIWQSQSFSGKRPAWTAWSSPWVKIGLLGVGGTFASVTAYAGLARHEVPQSPSTLQKSFFNRQQATTPPPTSTSLPSPDLPIAEFSATPTFDRVQVPKITSARIRAPLPGQVIRQQSGTVNSAPSKLPQATMKRTVPQKRKAASPSQPKAAAQPRSTAVAPAPLAPAPAISAPLPTLQKTQLPLAAPSAPLPTLQKTQLPLAAPASTTPMPPQVPSNEAGNQPTSSSVLPASVVSALAAAWAQGTEQPNSASVKATSEKSSQVFSNQVPEPLKQSIATAQTIQDFLKLSPQIPKEMQVAVLSLTPQAAIAVPKADEFETFQVFRFPEATYLKAWAMLTQSTNANQPLPTYGFIDYQQRAIVLVSP